MVEETHLDRDATATDAPDVLAAIDIGTNSVHLVVARMSGEGRFEVITRHKEVVRLGEVGDDQIRSITPDAMARGIDALRRCRSVLDTYGAPVAAVATSAVREADNGADFIEAARVEAGIDVEVISGYEEARLIQLGVLQALPVFDKSVLLCDIGGGSTEILIGQGGEVDLVRSFKLGAIRITQRFFPGGVVERGSLKKAKKFVDARLAPFAREAAAKKWDVAVGSSGTIECLTAMVLATEGSEPRSLNGSVVSRVQVASALASLVEAATPLERAAIAGVESARSDIIVGGAVILDRVMELLDIEEITFSDYALREGVIFDLYRRTHGGSMHHLSSLRRRSVEHLMSLCDDDPDHSHQVARVALELFDGLREQHELDDAHRELLEAAALLANVGLFISHSRHHHHSYYVIRNSEHLSGFNDHEIELIAQVARYHRRGVPSSKHSPFASLSVDDQKAVRRMAAMLRVAIGLDRSHRQTVAGVAVKVTKSRVALTLSAADGESVELDSFAADERAELLREELGRSVVIDVAPES